MNYKNEDQIQNINRVMKRLNYNSNNVTTKKKLKTENSNREMVGFKSQDNLILLKNPLSTQNIDPNLKNNKTKIQKQPYNSNNNRINTNNEYLIPLIPRKSNKSNSSVKINTKVNSKKYFTTKNLAYNKVDSSENFSNKINNKEIINFNNVISSNNFNIIYPGQKAVKIKGKKIINHYNDNINNHLTMTKSSIQITGNCPLNQSQNIYNSQSKIESIELNIEGNNSSKGKNTNNEKFQNKYILNQNYKNKTHLVKREPINRIKNYEINNNNINMKENLSPKLRHNTNILYSNNIKENPNNENLKIYYHYNSNGSYSNYNKKSQIIHSSKGESDKDIHFCKNTNQYNNIFFYNSNTNDANKMYNDNKNNFQYRENDIINDKFEYNEYNNEDKIIKNKFIYKKTGNIGEKKLIKINSSHIRVNNAHLIEQKIIQKISNEKKVKKNKNEDLIIKDKWSNEIKKNRNLNYNYNFNKIENKNISKNLKINNNLIIKKTEIKNKLKNSYDVIDFKLKIPKNGDYENEELMTLNLKKDNISEKIDKLLNDNSLDDSYYEPLLSLANNAINFLNNINDIDISKSIEIDTNNKNLFIENDNNFSSKDSSQMSFLDYSVVLDIIKNKMYKEYLEDIYYDIDEIKESAKILNRSI